MFTVIKKGIYTIGYLHYTDYTLRSHESLREVISTFKSEGVTDLVLDLRYNPGGYSITSQYLCSMLVPASMVESKSIYLTEEWNQDWMDYYKRKGEDVNSYYTYTYQYKNDDGVRVTDKIEESLELKDIYILTTGSTASASEATIVGLSPYIDVTLIGEATSGKYCGGILADPSYLYDSYPGFMENWDIYTMIYRFDNADPATTFNGSLSPDIPVEEDLLTCAAPLGDEQEPLLAVAIAHITGEPLPSAFPRSSCSRHKKMPDAVHRVQKAVGGMLRTEVTYK
ncbi:MAG: S41 family peptidase [Bacteroides sp.]|nr:S41 family peptidase [Bacteroides sp.]